MVHAIASKNYDKKTKKGLKTNLQQIVAARGGGLVRWVYRRSEGIAMCHHGQEVWVAEETRNDTSPWLDSR